MTSGLFLQKTLHVLAQCPAGVATWRLDGRSFVIHDVHTFESEWLPTVFRHRSFASFARQLRFYGFVKVKARDDACEFHHPEFLRDSPPDRVARIRRRTYAEDKTRDKSKTTTTTFDDDMDDLAGQMQAAEGALATLQEQIHGLKTAMQAAAMLPPSNLIVDQSSCRRETEDDQIVEL
ncbi:Aste57867_594 [Aphanomyces stellatus]|uniref:Aste57867_594 protein n=1 Tax=Aphanomyces stellatus TaxID=120398 RepID=A0A485K5N8_9STRA|nr:hypothetical protein As57867_000593 [Aphanomyces stellatus]VFT77819.1 Aste57867_594 [Aphanomyces stellatus]